MNKIKGGIRRYIFQFSNAKKKERDGANLFKTVSGAPTEESCEINERKKCHPHNNTEHVNL